ncbi:MAG: hypothetical protein DRQ51_07505 [Gammaproteobacteria bacterium]|nr:MAG: hypothetical protein DRQ51_07505 [Gammaproteobacteria bacterium]
MRDNKQNLILKLCARLGILLRQRNTKMATAESCTGGMLASFIIQNAGASAYFDSGFITYSNQAKQNLLNVDKKIIDKYGAVSFECVEQMLKGLLKKTKADYGVAISGVAGPKGGTKINPIGSVWIGVANNKKQQIKKYLFTGDRYEIQTKSTTRAIKDLIKILEL